MKNKNLDLVILNSLNDKEAGFMKNTNKVTIYTKKGDVAEYPAKDKRDVAKDIIEEILRYRKNNI